MYTNKQDFIKRKTSLVLSGVSRGVGGEVQVLTFFNVIEKRETISVFHTTS